MCMVLAQALAPCYSIGASVNLAAAVDVKVFWALQRDRILATGSKVTKKRLCSHKQQWGKVFLRNVLQMVFHGSENYSLVLRCRSIALQASAPIRGLIMMWRRGPYSMPWNCSTSGRLRSCRSAVQRSTARRSIALCCVALGLILLESSDAVSWAPLQGGLRN